MKILFILTRCADMYQTRIILNIMALIESNYDIEFIDGERKITKKLEGKQPDVIYLVTGDEYDIYNEIVNYFHGKKPLIVSPTLKYVDVHIHGEPESAFPLLIEAIEQGKDFSQVPGITYKVTTKKTNKFDINTIPSVNKNYRWAMSTRGCKGQCSFCNLRETNGVLRFRDLFQTVEEIKEFMSNSCNGQYQFADCSFDSNPPARMKKLLKMLIKEVPGTTFKANFRPDFWKMADNEIWDLLTNAGLIGAFIGVESFNEVDLNLYNKQCTLSDIENTIQAFQEHDVDVQIGFININPFSTFEGLRQNLELLRRYGQATPQRLFSCLEISEEMPIVQKIRDAGLLLSDTVYKSLDERIGFLRVFWDMHKDMLHQNAYDVFNSLELTEIKRVKRLCNFYQIQPKIKVIEIVDRYEKQFQDILRKRSDKMAEWFGILLNMAEQIHGYQAEDYSAISKNYLNDVYMKEINRQFYGLLKELRKEVKAALS